MKIDFIPSTFDRLIARGIDWGCELVLLSPVLVVLMSSSQAGDGWSIHWASALYIVFIRVAYESLSLWLFDATPGKWVMGLKVRPSTDRGQSLDFIQILNRVVVSRLSVFFSWAGYALMFFKYDRTHLADWVAGTRVVGDRPRRSHATQRWVLGFFLIVLFARVGVEGFMETAEKVTFNQGYFHSP